MKDRKFKTLFCESVPCHSLDYKRKSLFTFLTKRARLLYPIAVLINPNAFHPERRLMQSIAKATTLLDIQYDIDFYQHKNVVNSLFRGTLHFRASGKKIMSYAKSLYLSENAKKIAS